MKQRKKYLILIFCVVIVVAAILGMLYFTTDILKSKKDIFFKYVSKIHIIDSDFTTKCVNTINKKQKNNYSSNTKVNTIQINGEDVNENKVFEIKSNGLKNINTNQSYNDFTIYNNGQQLFTTLKLIKDGENYAIGMDNILLKYIGIRGSEFKNLITKLGAENINNIPTHLSFNNYSELINTNPETINTIKTTYSKLIYNNIDKSNFSKIKNKDKTETISLSLSEQEVGSLIEIILETAKNDTLLLNLIVEKADLMGYTIDMQQVQNQIQTNIDKLKNKEYSNEKDSIIISLIKENEIVTKVLLQRKCNKKDELNEQNSIQIIYNLELDISDKRKINLSIKENNQEKANYIFEYGYDENNLSTNIYIKNENNVIKNKYEINNYQTDNISEKNVLDIKTQERSYQINLNRNTSINSDVQIQKLTTENFVDLSNKTPEELSNLFSAILNKIMNLYGTQINNLQM